MSILLAKFFFIAYQSNREYTLDTSEKRAALDQRVAVD
jgi:hypothetical protein